ncbi:hypothetical protein [Streptomyces hirsutus]|uniref:hypothetical protein n=1 Tax=Streptomyces hirsutus TaxID=35620 RepID=UPI003641BBA6
MTSAYLRGVAAARIRPNCEQDEQPRQNASKSPALWPAPRSGPSPAEDLPQLLEAAVAADRARKTHEAVRLEPTAALPRADPQSENPVVTEVSWGTEAASPSVRPSHPAQRPTPASAQARHGFRRPAHALPSEADHLCLVLSEPPAEARSADSVRAVFTVDVT